MDFSNMNGYEFEDLIVQLMQKMGFRVHATSYSGDGGIDMLAYYDKPVFKGKYLVQCKNWTNQVGQPVVRDVYGITVSEGANKGIIITTSAFTEQAEEFARNKNIELIGKDVLEALLSEYGMKTGSEYKSSGFLNTPAFEKDQYLYYMHKIEEDRKNKICYRKLYDIFENHIMAGEYTGEYDGILDSYISVLQMENKNRLTSKKDLDEKSFNVIIESFLRLLKGEFSKTFEMMDIQSPGVFSACVWDERTKNILAVNYYLSGILSFFATLHFAEAVKYINQHYYSYLYDHGIIPPDFPMTEYVLFPRLTGYHNSKTRQINGDPSKKIRISTAIKNINDLEARLRSLAETIRLLS